MSRSSVSDPYRLVGNVIANKYRFEEYAGGGGMGVVYRAVSLEQARSYVAVKFLKPELAIKNPSLIDLFQSEVMAARKLVHPHIVQVIDSGLSDNLSYMVMEWLSGQTLEDYINSGTLSLATTAHLFRQLCEALEAAHQAQIIHLDVKPGNVFLLNEVDPFVKVIDFGMAKILKSESGITITRLTGGTPKYMSPEHQF